MRVILNVVLSLGVLHSRIQKKWRIAPVVSTLAFITLIAIPARLVKVSYFGLGANSVQTIYFRRWCIWKRRHGYIMPVFLCNGFIRLLFKLVKLGCR